ncbi:MAG: family 10 glycosylhydrolase [Muribaculaceae bacterium]|nr:family 10 glycosylhydrolase [Muribaculaceae bacterium]
MMKRLMACLLLGLVLCEAHAADEAQKREMRTVWVATVSNIDWPQTRGTGATVIAKQQQQLTDLLDGFEAANMNAICLQVRPMADALYKSSYEPWSSYLTGTRGKDPGWDPLLFAVQECHKRGLECHVWVNPYRFSNSGGRDCTTAQDEALKQSGILLTMGDRIVFNPGLEASRQRVVNVCREMIENYDIDGIIFDDYFYPSVTGGIPTDSSAPDYDLWQQSGTTLSIADWRRAQVNLMVRNVYDMVQTVRPGVKFAIGPAGVAGTRSTSAAKHGVDPCPTGSDWQYNGIYSDPLAWLEEGTIDYISPQLYWKTNHSTNPVGPLTKWWSYAANHFGRHHYASHNIYFMASTNTQEDWDEILEQIRLSREYNLDNAPGVNFYSAKYISGPTCTGFGDYLAQKMFQHKALTPALTWKEKQVLGQVADAKRSGNTLSWTGIDHKPIKYGVYAIPTSMPVDQIKSAKFEGIMSDYLMKIAFDAACEIPAEFRTGYWFAITAIDGWGNEYEPTYVDAPAGEADAVTLIAPTAGSVVTWRQAFSWTSATAATYRLQVATDSLFANVVIDEKGLTDAHRTLNLIALTAEAPHYWRVIVSQSGKFDKTSAFSSFVTPEREKTPATQLISPEDGAELTDATTLRCGVVQADAYTLQVAADPGFDEVKYTSSDFQVVPAEGVTFGFQPSAVGKGTFYWRVLTRKEGYEDGVSDVRSFVITRLDVGNLEPGYVLKRDIDTYDPQGRLTLTSKWIRSVKSDYANITFDGDGLMNRGFTVKDGKVLVIGRSEGSSTADIYIDQYSAETGERIKRVPVDAAAQCSYYPANDIFQDDAGHVLISNLTLNVGSNPLKIYQVDPETGAVTLMASLTTESTATKRVDHCNVMGDVTARSFQVYAAMSNGTQVVRWQVAGAGSGSILGSQIMTAKAFLPADASYFGLAPRVYPAHDGTVYVTGGSTHLTRYDMATGEIVDGFDKNTAIQPASTEANGAAFFTLQGKNYMLYPYSDFRSSTGFRFMLAQSEGGERYADYQLGWIFPERGLGGVNSSTWSAHCAVADGNRPNQKDLYLYVPGNGIAAYRLTAGILGDVNGDGVVDVADVNLVVNMILGGAPIDALADVNGDGYVDVSDVNAIINLVLGK